MLVGAVLVAVPSCEEAEEAEEEGGAVRFWSSDMFLTELNARGSNLHHA